MRFILVALLALAVSASPQFRSRPEGVETGGRRPSSRIGRPTTAQNIIPVVVGGSQNTFVPNTLTAAVGDTIQFQFATGNHTVTQSAENAPCQPLQATDPTALHSGHIPFQAGQTEVGTFNVEVTSTETMFLYCATDGHCLEGQVMVVNPTSPNQLQDYAKAAAAAPANVDGGEPSGGIVGTISVEAASFAVPPPAAAAPAAPPAAAPADAPAAAPAAGTQDQAEAQTGSGRTGGTLAQRPSGRLTGAGSNNSAVRVGAE